MTAKDSKSTPKKAESAPRQALELLAELERLMPLAAPGPYHHDARATDYITARPGGIEQALAVVRTSSSPETGDLLALSWDLARAIQSLVAENAALRAQAEAEAVPDEEAARTHRWLTLRKDLTSVFEKLGCFDESGEWRDTDEADEWRALAHKIYESADRLGRMNRRAALAQAGGES